MSFKLFKDPIYGYVEIDSEIVRSIIDTACFQRLRNIRQTSYAPLYPASFHNRFIHSIGVYHLGRKVFDSVHNSTGSLEQTFLEELDNIKRLFELACLLHDVGHAPFSHTGERFFLGAPGGILFGSQKLNIGPFLIVNWEKINWMNLKLLLKSLRSI